MVLLSEALAPLRLMAKSIRLVDATAFDRSSGENPRDHDIGSCNFVVECQKEL